MRILNGALQRLISLLLVLALWPSIALAQAPYVWTEPGDEAAPRVHLYFFWSQKCPHCLEARPELEALARSQPWIVLHSLELTKSQANVERYIAMAAELGQQAQSVPALFFCRQMQVGWQTGGLSRTMLLEQMNQCRSQVASGG
jgi:glutaredoxin-related protein